MSKNAIESLTCIIAVIALASLSTKSDNFNTWSCHLSKNTRFNHGWWQTLIPNLKLSLQHSSSMQQCAKTENVSLAWALLCKPNATFFPRLSSNQNYRITVKAQFCGTYVEQVWNPGTNFIQHAKQEQISEAIHIVKAFLQIRMANSVASQCAIKSWLEFKFI